MLPAYLPSTKRVAVEARKDNGRAAGRGAHSVQGLQDIEKYFDGGRPLGVHPCNSTVMYITVKQVKHDNFWKQLPELVPSALSGEIAI
eukprot:2717538-Amphidinium_carterae.1